MEHHRLRNYRGPETWARVRAAYVAGESAPSVARRFDVGLSNLRRRALAEGWTRSRIAERLDFKPLRGGADDPPPALVALSPAGETAEPSYISPEVAVARALRLEGARPRGDGGRLLTEGFKPSGFADAHLAAVDPSTHPKPPGGFEFMGRWEGEPLPNGLGDDGLADGVFRAFFNRGGDLQQALGRFQGPAEGLQVRHRRPARRDRAGHRLPQDARVVQGPVCTLDVAGSV
jgi:hypothetical protein